MALYAFNIESCMPHSIIMQPYKSYPVVVLSSSWWKRTSLYQQYQNDYYYFRMLELRWWDTASYTSVISLVRGVDQQYVLFRQLVLTLSSCGPCHEMKDCISSIGWWYATSRQFITVELLFSSKSWRLPIRCASTHWLVWFACYWPAVIESEHNLSRL